MMRVLDSLYDGVIVIGPDTRILYVNPAYTRILGVRGEKILGRLLSEVEPGARILDVVRTGKPVVNEYVTIHLKPCWKANFSDTRKGPLPGPGARERWESWNWPTRAPCFSTRLET